MNIAGAVILYNPDSTVVDNIGSYVAFVSKLYVIDNSEKPLPGIKEMLSLFPQVVYHAYYENQGTAQRLNEAANLAIKDGYSFLLTMDQDSSFNPGVFENYLAKTERWLEKNNDAGVFAVNFQPDFVPSVEQPQLVLSTITSGSIISLTVFQKIGGFDENFFLDLVDADYCYRVHAAGFTTVLFSDIILNHTIGQFVIGRSLKNFRKSKRRIHPFVRIYYLVRNSFYLLDKNYVNKQIRKEIYHCLGLLKNNLLYNNTGQVLKYMAKGYKDYKKGKMGKLEL
ncbi:MAG: hypothetical protein LCH51_00875 [Bacteroidetes bacterium]|nr:hypothetical protein [Bacteroidota bacterium]